MIIIDGSFLGHRSTGHYAELGYVGASGRWVSTGTVYSFLKDLIELLQIFPGESFIIAWDSAPEVRRKLYSKYKMQRVVGRKRDVKAQYKYNKMQIQLNELRVVLPYAGIKQAYAEGHEADDILATLSSQDGSAILVANDKDLYQLLTGDVAIFNFSELRNLSWFTNAFGVEPTDWVEIQALMGDAADNIPGINGVGIKTATKLVKKYGTAEKALEKEEWIGEKAAQDVRVARQLVELRSDIDLDITEPAPDREKFTEFLVHKKMRTILESIDLFYP